MANDILQPQHIPLVLLSPPLPLEELREKLWGTLVRHPYQPTDDYATLDVKREEWPITLLPKIEDTRPLLLDGFREVISKAGNAEASLDIAKVFGAWGRINSDSTNAQRGERGKFWFMEAPGKRFTELLEKQPIYNAQAKSLFNNILKDWNQDAELKAYFVSSMFGLEEYEKSSSEDRGFGGGVRGTVTEPHTNMEILKGKIGGEKNESRSVDATIKSPVIIALGYHEVTLRMKKPEGLKGWFKKIGGKADQSIVGNIYEIDDTTWKQMQPALSRRVGGGFKIFGHEDEPAKAEAAEGHEESNGAVTGDENTSKTAHPVPVLFAPPPTHDNTKQTAIQR